MIGVLSKPADQIDISDIKSLIDSEVPEGEQIEFKENLSTKGGSDDPWNTGKNKIGEQAKDALLKEVVGFANAQGGAVLLGIGESEAKPPVAAKILPVQRCADLAESLKLVFRDRVEPQLPRIDIFAVRTRGERGVVIFRVGRSRLAPHRVTRSLVCPIRRSSQEIYWAKTEASSFLLMTMRLAVYVLSAMTSSVRKISSLQSFGKRCFHQRTRLRLSRKIMII